MIFHEQLLVIPPIATDGYTAAMGLIYFLKPINEAVL